MARLKILSVLSAGVILAGIPTTARAQVDLSGFWSNPNFEDVMERLDGPAIGDFTGLPITAAGRRALRVQLLAPQPDQLNRHGSRLRIIRLA